MPTNRKRISRGRVIGADGLTEAAFQYFSWGPFFEAEDWALSKTKEEIEIMAEGGKILAKAMKELEKNVRPGDEIFAPKVGGLLSFYFPAIGKYERRSFDQPAPEDGRLFVIDTQYADANDRQTMDDLQKKALLPQRLQFRGIKISVVSR